MSVAVPLYTIAADLAALCDALIDNNGELSDELRIQLETTQEAFETKLASCAHMVRNLQAEQKKHAEEAERQRARAQVLDRAAESLKGYMKLQMDVAGVKKVEGVARLQNNSQPSVTFAGDVDALPDALKRVRVEPNIRAVVDMVKADGVVPEGFTVEWGTHLRLI